MSEATRLLEAGEAGDRQGAVDLLPLVYDELRKLAAARMAAEAPGHTLVATALVHEAYLRLVGPADEARWDGRAHFFAAAAEAMRRILVNHVRDGNRPDRVPEPRVAPSNDGPADRDHTGGAPLQRPTGPQGRTVSTRHVVPLALARLLTPGFEAASSAAKSPRSC